MTSYIRPSHLAKIKVVAIRSFGRYVPEEEGFLLRRERPQYGPESRHVRVLPTAQGVLRAGLQEIDVHLLAAAHKHLKFVPRKQTEVVDGYHGGQTAADGLHLYKRTSA